MTRKILALLAPGALILPLFACSSEPEEVSDNQDAKGEILGGSISDEMLPLATVTSQSPALAGEETGASGTGAGETAGDSEPPADEPGDRDAELPGDASNASPGAEPESQEGN